jgi:hypothetical protein
VNRHGKQWDRSASDASCEQDFVIRQNIVLEPGVLTLDRLPRASRSLVPSNHIRIYSSTPDISFIRESTLTYGVGTGTSTRHHTADISRMSSLELVHELKRLCVYDADFRRRMSEKQMGSRRGQVWSQRQDVRLVR